MLAEPGTGEDVRRKLPATPVQDTSSVLSCASPTTSVPDRAKFNSNEESVSDTGQLAI